MAKIEVSGGTFQLDKKHEGKELMPDAAETVQPGKKPTLKRHAKDEKKDEAGTE